MTLFLDDCPRRAVVIFNTLSAVGTLFRVDDIGFFALVNSAYRAFEKAAAALYAVFSYFICHAGLPLKQLCEIPFLH